MRPRATSRSLENPKIPLSNEAITQYLGRGNETFSGATVSRDTSLGLSAFWRGVNLIANTVAKVPMDVYVRDSDDGRHVDSMHNAQWLLHNEPNKAMTPFVFKKTCQAHVLTHGNAVCWLYAPRGKVEEILPLDPDYTCLEKKDGQLWYRSRLEDSELWLLPQDVLHIRGLTSEGWWGYSVIDMLREVIGHGIALQRYGNVFFRNNAAPKVVLKLPLGKSLKSQEAVERLRESWGRVHAGLDNAHKPAILEDGTDVEPFQISNKDVEFLESRKFSLVDMANVFGLQPHKLGDSARTSYNSLEMENQSFLDDTMDPWFVTWEQECMRKLFSYGERLRDKRYIEFKRQALLRTDFAARSEAYVKLFSVGAISPDEIRRLENMNPIQGGKGSDHYIPLNLGVLGQPPPAEEPQPKAEEEPTEKPVEKPRSFDDVLAWQREKAQMEVARFHRRIAEHARRAAQKPHKFHEWLDVHLLADNREAFYSAMRPIVCTITKIERGSTGDDTATFVDSWFSSIRSELNELTGTVTADELETRVSAYFLESEPKLFGGSYAA